MIMVHGDDRGLALPPRVAPVQVIDDPRRPLKNEARDVMEPFDRTLR